VAERSDIHVEWWRSPRVIVVESPSTDLTVQDLVDTLRHLEEEMNTLDDEFLLDASGKQSLGGTAKVGITVILNNAQISFAARTISISSGTATSTGSSDGLPGIILTDIAAGFVVDDVKAGDTVFNITDQSSACVISVLSPTQVKTYPLQDGTGNDWGIGDVYKIYSGVECTISGGNVVAQDTNGDPISAILPSSFVSLTKELSTSAALIVSGSGVTAQDKLDIADRVWDESETGHNNAGTMGALAILLRKVTANKVTKSGNIITIYEDNGTDVWRQYDLSSGGRVLV
jgi:hypothetical protein